METNKSWEIARNFVAANARTINSATKYEAIPTYHTIGDRGRLSIPHLQFPKTEIYLTEKIDGTNARLIYVGGGIWVIGSREELLWCTGDIFHSRDEDIAENLRTITAQLTTVVNPIVQDGYLLVIFGELYGGKINKSAKQYTSTKQFGFRVFDIAYSPIEILSQSVEKVSLWRQHGGQRFLDCITMQDTAKALGLQTVPYVSVTNQLPAGLTEVYAYLSDLINRSHATLDQVADGKPEGIVARTIDRKVIAKLRFEDYERTLRTTEGKRDERIHSPVST